MVVEVVARNVGEYRSGKAQTRHAVLHQTVRAHLDEHHLTAGVPHASQMALKYPSIGSSMGCGFFDGVHADLDGADKARFGSAVHQHVVEQGRGRGFAVGPCYADHAHAMAGLVKPGACN